MGTAKSNMSGALMQLVCYGAKDEVLTGKPEITFFKTIHRRHTHFAMSSAPQVSTGTPRKVTLLFFSLSFDSGLFFALKTGLVIASRALSTAAQATSSRGSASSAAAFHPRVRVN